MISAFWLGGTVLQSGVLTNLFAYDGLDLVSETPHGMEITRTVDNFAHPPGFTPGPDYEVTYDCDSYGRFHSVYSSMQSVSSVVEYSRLPDGFSVGLPLGLNESSRICDATAL